MFELAPAAVEYAINNQTETAKFIAEEADARNINRANESADVVLIMGPLYHLIDREDRMKVLREAYRVLKKGGILVAVAITKYCNAIWSIDTIHQIKNDTSVMGMSPHFMVIGKK